VSILLILKMINKRKFAIALGIIVIITTIILFGWNRAKVSRAQYKSLDPTTEELEQQTIPSIMGVVRQGEVDTQNVDIGEADKIVLFCIGIGSPLKLALIDPSGNVIDSSASTRSNSIKYFRQEKIEEEIFKGAHINGFTILDNSSPGIWKLCIAPASSAADSITYMINSNLENPTIRLISSSDKIFYKSSDPIVITANLIYLSEPILEAKVTAIVARMPDSLRDTMVLRDDGIDGDLRPSDGIYTGIYKNTSLSGFYSFYICAKDSPNHKFSRENTLGVSVANTRSSIVGIIKDYGLDIDGDTLFDSLIFDIDLDISPGQRYSINGDLYDKNDSLLANGSLDIMLREGRDTIALAFEGELISRNRVDGPYLLKDLGLEEVNDSGGIAVGLLEAAGQSKKYSFREFQGPAILIMGKHSDEGIDIDGDGLFDSLKIEIDAELRYADNYHWGFYLWSPGGNQIDLGMNKGYLKSGMITFSATFSGNNIAKSRIDGPYIFGGVGMYGDKGASTITCPKIKISGYRYSQFGD
jgi:hypothetical protein